MKQFVKRNCQNIISAFCLLVVALFWLALRVNWSGISKALGADKNPSFFVMETPLLICIFLWLAFAFAVIAPFIFKGKKFTWIVNYAVSGLFFAVIIGVVVGGAYDYLDFIFPKFFSSLAVSLGVLALALLLFFPNPSNKGVALILKCAILAVVIVGSVLIGYGVKINRFTYDAVVYAVEDDYQIVFSTSHSAIAWVEIDGTAYYDLYAGSMKSKDTVHKVVVPQRVLDEAKSYAIVAQNMIYRGPFGGYKGKQIRVEHDFAPVDSSDGLTYYSLSDVHGSFSGAVKSATYDENVDFFVFAGDMFSMVDSEYDAQFANKIASKLTGGAKPVIYARGNHEVKGNYAEDLHKYVGSKNGNFYYWFSLEKVFGVVLDVGEDHDDDWWEYYGTAQFDLYRNEQAQFLQGLIDENSYDGFEYKMAICHVPVPFVNYRHNHEDCKNQWTELLNQMQIDVFLSGHQHDLNVFEPGVVAPNTKLTYNANFKGDGTSTYNGYLTDFNFVGFMVARASNEQKGDTQVVGNDQFTGLYASVDFATGKQTFKFTNAKHEVVSVCNMFGTDAPKGEFVFDIVTK